MPAPTRVETDWFDSQTSRDDGASISQSAPPGSQSETVPQSVPRCPLPITSLETEESVHFEPGKLTPTGAPAQSTELEPAQREALSESELRVEVAALFAQLRPEIKRLIERYLDRRLLRRVDPSDVVQSAYLDVHVRLARYLRERPMEVRPWLFFLAKMKTLETNQHHLASQKRDPGREVGNASGMREIPDTATSPSQAISREESRQRLLVAIDQLPENYRQIIQLRHVHNVSNRAASEQLGLSENAASKLYVRALNALQRILSGRS